MPDAEPLVGATLQTLRLSQRPAPLAPAAPVLSDRGASSARDTNTLALSLTADPAVLDGGDGSVVVAPTRVTSNEVTVRDVRLRVRASAVARLKSAAGSGWSCRLAGDGRSADCMYSPVVTPAGTVTPISVVVNAGAAGRFGSGTLQARLAWTEPDGARGERHGDSGSLKLFARRPLTVTARAPEGRVGDAVRGDPVQNVTLQGAIGARGNEPIRYEWRQLCPTPGGCPRVRWTSTHEGDLTEGQPDASFAMPQVSKAQTLRFELAASDPRGRVADTTEVRVLPQEVARIDPRLKLTQRAERLLKGIHAKGRAVRLDGSERATVRIGAGGPTTASPGARVRLVATVVGQRVRRVHWTVLEGPSNMLAGANRTRNGITFRAPAFAGSFVVGMTATTSKGRYVRDELVIVTQPALKALASAVRGGRSDAAVAAADTRMRAFCSVLSGARDNAGAVEISLESGQRFTAKLDDIPSGDGCTGREELRFSDGKAVLGSFRMTDLKGTITLEGGAEISSGRLHAPEFWSSSLQSERDVARSAAKTRVRARSAAWPVATAAAAGPSIAFALPKGSKGVTAGLRVQLGNGGWEDLGGELSVDQNALSELPLGGSLPAGFQLSKITLAVVPAAASFRLSAQAKGPTDGLIELDGVLTFDGVIRVQVNAANIAVLQSVDKGSCGGQSAISAHGELQVLPGQDYNPDQPESSSYFPIADVSVSGKIDCYEPTPGLVLKGEVSWSSSGPLRVAATLTADLKGKQDIKAEVVGSYLNSTNWDLKASLSAEHGVKIGDLMTLDELRGDIARSGTGQDSKLTVNLHGKVSDFKPGLGVKVAEAEATIGNSACDFEGPLRTSVDAHAAAVGADPLCLTVNAGLTLDIPGLKTPLPVQGGLVVDLSTLKFSIAGGIPDKPNSGPEQAFGPGEFHLSGVRLFATNADSAALACSGLAARTARAGGPPARTAAGVTFGFSAHGKILGVNVKHIAGAYLNGGNYCLSADLGAANLPANGSGDVIKPVDEPKQQACANAGAPAMQNLRVEYSSADNRASLNGKFCLPEGLRARLGRAAEGTGELALNFTKTNNALSLDGGIKYTLPSSGYWLLGAAPNSNGSSPDPDKAALALNSLDITLKLEAGQLELGLNAGGTLRIPKPSDSKQFDGKAHDPAQAKLSLSATATLGSNPSFTITTMITGGGAGGPCTGSRVAIPDLFGQPGLNLCSLGISGVLKASPEISVAADFALPAEWGKNLGVSNASYRVGFSISAGNPCLDLAISQLDPSKPAVDLFNRGAIVANSLHILVAPTGCTLPAGTNLPDAGAHKVIPAGFELSFDGALYGTPVKLLSRLELTGSGFGIEAHLKVGEPGKPFKLGSLDFDATTLDLTVKPAQNIYRFHIDTGATFGTGRFELKADFESTGSGASRTIKLDGSAKLRFELLKATYDGEMTFSFSSSPAGANPPSQAVKANFKGHFNLNLQFFQVSVDVKNLEYDSTQGGLQVLKVIGGTTVSQSLGSAASFSANGSVDYTRQSNRIHITMGAAVRLWNFIHFTKTIDIDLGPVSIPFHFGPRGEVHWIYPPLNAGIKISGGLSGALTWSPNHGFGVTLDNGFNVEACLGGCFTVAGLEINKQTGGMTVKVVGIPIEIPPQTYSGQQPPPPDYGGRVGSLISNLNGKCIDVPNADAVDQARLQMHDCNQSKAQRFYLNGETGEIRVQGKCMDAGLEKRGDLIRIDRCHRGGNQIFHRDDAGHLVALGGQCLDIVNINRDNGARIQLLECKDIPSQKWSISGELRAGRTLDACLDTADHQPNLGSLVTVERCAPAEPAQVFFFTSGGLVQINRFFGLCLSATDLHGGQLKVVNCDASQASQRWTGPDRNGTIHLKGTPAACLTSGGTPGSPVRIGDCRDAVRDENRWSIGGYEYK